MPELEITSTRPLELDLAIVATLLHPMPSDFRQRQTCRADLARVQGSLLAEFVKRGRYGLHLEGGAVPVRNDLEEDRLAGLLRDSGYGLVAETTRFLLMAAL